MCHCLKGAVASLSLAFLLGLLSSTYEAVSLNPRWLLSVPQIHANSKVFANILMDGILIRKGDLLYWVQIVGSLFSGLNQEIGVYGSHSQLNFILFPL